MTVWVKAVISLTFVVVLIVGYFAPMMESTMSVGAATNYLENRGYVVFSAAEYDLLAKEATAQAAAANAEAAVIAAEAAADAAETAASNAADARVAAQEAAAKVDLFNSAEVYLFPDVTDITCTLTAGTTNDWSAWTEVADSTAVTLSSKFAAAAGYIGDIHTYTYSDEVDTYVIELAYGADKDILGRIRFYAPTKTAVDLTSIKTRRVPAGETVYYRMMSSGATGATVMVGFRYFYE